MPTRFLISQYQIIAFLILKSNIIQNSRIELRGIVLPDLQIKLKLHLLSFYPSTWYIYNFFLFHIQIVGKCGWIMGGGGAKGYIGLPSQIIGGAACPPPPPLAPPSSYAYVIIKDCVRNGSETSFRGKQINLTQQNRITTQLASF